MKFKTLAATATLALCTSALTLAQTGAQTGSQTSSQSGIQTGTDSAGASGQSGSFTAMDKKFLTASAQSDMAEMSMAQLALQKSSNDDIKSYAQQMMTDHQQTSSATKPVIAKAGLTPPTDVNAIQKSQMKKLQGLSGTQFDQEYVKANVKDHRMLEKMGKEEASSTKNSDMQTLTATANPIISDHAQKAQALADKMGVKGSNTLPSDKSGQ